VIEATRGLRQEGLAQGARVLVLTSKERDAALVVGRLDRKLEAWDVEVRHLHGDPEAAALAAEAAIVQVEPSLVLFIGSGVATDPTAAGDVVIADRASALERGAGPRIRPRRRTRRADPSLVRHARRVCAGNRRRRLLEAQGQAGCDVRIGLVATGSLALATWTRDGAEAFRRLFTEAIALDQSGWDFVSGYYDDEDLPALAILGLAAAGGSGDEDATARACERAAAVALELLAAVPPAGLRQDPIDTAAEEGESEHLRGDAEILPHESTQGIVQRPLLDSRRAESARGGGTPRTLKKQVSPAVVNGGLHPEGVMPADLWLRIKLRENRLLFELHSDRADLPYHMRAVGETELSGEFGGSPREYRENLKARIRAIAARPDDSDIEALENLGDRVYNDLFPDELKRAYAEFRENEDVKTLLVTSEEPWIPWELVRPHDQAFPNDDFLCTRYAMTRWLVGASPKSVFRIDAIASLEAAAVDGEDFLPSAKQECDYVTELAARRRVENLSPGSATYELVKSLLRLSDRDVHLWHVAAHGSLGPTDPDESVIVFKDQKWRAGDLAGRYGYSIKRARPLVFFNACLVGQQDFSLARLAGWPAAWVVQNGCGGFLAPQWSIDSELATVFSKAFYEAVVGDDDRPGATLGEAARIARLAVREQRPVDPAWLSYAVYGHPNARVHFGERAQQAVA